MRIRSPVRKKLPSKLGSRTAAPTAKAGILSTSEVSSKRELPRAFGKLGTKAPLAVATGRTGANGMVGTFVASALPSYGPLALKVCVTLWIVAVLVSVFVVTKA
jgi:hypothetical protein